jgi:cytochrome P450 family 110
MGLPPGPESPSWTQAQAWIENPVDFWQRCQAQFGDIFTVQLGSLGPVVLFSEPTAVRQIFQLPPATYECRQYNEQYKYVMGEQSLLVSDGASHRSRRRLLMPPLHQATSSRVAQTTRRLAEEIVHSWPQDQPFSIRPSIHLLSLQIMLDVVFGDLSRKICQEILQLYKDEILKSAGTWGPWRRFAQLQPRLRELISGEILAERTHVSRHGAGLFSGWIQATDETGSPLRDDEIQDHVFTMLVAGVDPSAIAITWALYWIHNSPEVKATIMRELEAQTTSPNPRAFAELPYLSAVCQEVLRMYPVVTTPTGRKLTAAVEISGLSFDPGVTLLPCTYLVHHRSDLYPEPDRFRPERFLERQYGPHEYFPFGGGNRACIGSTLAPVEIKVALGTILSRSNLASADEGPVRPVRHGTLLAPSEAMKLIFTSGSSHG